MGKPVEKKRKKKGRPSLLDLQKRSLRLQKQQEEQQQQQKRGQNPSPNPYVRFPNSVPIRRSTRKSGETEEAAEDGEDDEEEDGGKRREKKLKLVLRLHQNNGTTRSEDPQEGHSVSDSSGPESRHDGVTTRKEKKIDAVGGDGSGLEKNERCSTSVQATGGELPDPTVATPLPDKKLLTFILDRLQKKDTYGVFSEPVDPNELPDYHDVIKHPMDFGTVRKRLSGGYYKTLEAFEKDVFLICTNAMSYNAPDTIYFRQARSIHELAKKDFDNLRQDSEEDEPEPKVIRRGRPPGKSGPKKPVGRPSGDRASVDFSSDTTLANAGDNILTWSSSSHDNGLRLVNGEGSTWMGDKSDGYDDPGSWGRGVPVRMGKKVAVLDENRRHTYNQPQSSKGWYEPPILAALDGEKRMLVPVGLYGEHAYARSLARFAANLGPVGWEIAARQIEKALPPGTMFDRGWVGEPDQPGQYQPPLLSPSPLNPSSQADTATTVPKGDAVQTPSGSSPLFSCQSSSGEPSRAQGYSGGVAAAAPKAALQLQHGAGGPSLINGFSSAVKSSLVQFGRMVHPAVPPLTHAGALEMVSRGGTMAYATKDPSTGEAGVEQGGSSTPARRGLSLRPAPESTPPPDLNVMFQSPSSPPTSGSGFADSQQPDLALQL